MLQERQLYGINPTNKQARQPRFSFSTPCPFRIFFFNYFFGLGRLTFHGLRAREWQWVFKALLWRYCVWVGDGAPVDGDVLYDCVVHTYERRRNQNKTKQTKETSKQHLAFGFLLYRLPFPSSKSCSDFLSLCMKQAVESQAYWMEWEWVSELELWLRLHVLNGVLIG